MGFSDPRWLPRRNPRGSRKPVTFTARDEQEVRARLRRAYHRPEDEPWKESILRIRAVHRGRISRWLRQGTIDLPLAERMRRCTPPNASTAKDFRRYCAHAACPYCHHRRLLYLYRQLWHHLCQPELERRRASRTRRGLRTRLALGQVCVDVEPGDDVRARVRELLGSRIVRKIQRAGQIEDGVATVSIHRRKLGYRVRFSLLGLTDRPVQREQPQGPLARGRRGRPPDWSIKWRAAISGHDAPKFGPDSLLRLLSRALPVSNDDTGLRVKRLQPLGRCRDFVEARPHVFPAPILYQSSWLKRRRVVMSCPQCSPPGDQQIMLQSCLAQLRGRIQHGDDIRVFLNDTENDLPADFRFVAAATSPGLEDVADRWREAAKRHLARWPSRLEILRPLLPGPFIEEVTRLQVRKASTRELCAGCNPNVLTPYDPAHQLSRFVARRLLKRVSQECALTPRQTDVIVGRFFKESRGFNDWKDKDGRVVVDWVCTQLGMPVVLRSWYDRMDQIEGFVAPPGAGGQTWEAVAAELDAFSSTSMCFAMRPPGKNRGAVVLHRIDDAMRHGAATRVPHTDVIVQELDVFLDYLITVWSNRPKTFSEILDLAHRPAEISLSA